MSVATKLKAEREKFYDALLQKILVLPSVQEYIKDLKTGETKISGVETEYDYEQSALDDFFTADPKEILAVEEIWQMVKEEVREEAEWITSDRKTFLDKYDDLKAEDIMIDKLEEISDELDRALKRRHGKR